MEEGNVKPRTEKKKQKGLKRAVRTKNTPN